MSEKTLHRAVCDYIKMENNTYLWNRIVEIDPSAKRKPELPSDSFCSGLFNKLVIMGLVLNKECKVCGKWFHLKPSHLHNRVTCSLRCMSIYFKSKMKGDGNPNYKNTHVRACHKKTDSYLKHRKKEYYEIGS